jgi:hypothetical protein
VRHREHARQQLQVVQADAVLIFSFIFFPFFARLVLFLLVSYPITAMRAVPVMLFALLAAMLVAGCISSIGSTQGYTNDYASNLKARVPVADATNTVQCKEANCVCMVCKKGTTFFGFFTSLAGGSCYFDSQCDPAKFQSIAKGTFTDKTVVPNHFRLGQGPSFTDFGNSNPWCANRGGLAVQWLIGTPGNPYSLPSARRALCMLDKGVIPVYVLYSKGQDINIAQTTKIAYSLGHDAGSVTGGRLPGPVGPVVVTTEINYNVSQAPQIRLQIKAIKSNCPNCLVAVAPRLGDYAALNAVMEDNPGTPQAVLDPDMNKSVDLVAYGIDSDSLSLAGYCGTPSVAWENATAFSRYTLYNLSKPSIIPYVIFDAAGNDSSGTCAWTEATMIQGYSAFFDKNYDQTLPTIGVIGVAVYSFNSTSFGLNNPIGCKDCDIGKNQNRLRAWYGGCQAYANLSRKLTSGLDSYPSDGTLLRYADQPSGTCQDDVANVAAKMTNTVYGNGVDTDFLNPKPATLVQPSTTTPLFRCDACVSEKNGSAPFNFPELTVPQTYCTANPELDYFAGQRSLDPIYVRAVVAQESQFGQCTVAKVNLGQGCYAEGYTSMSDPSQNCPSLGSGISRYCGLGLMQVLEPPIDYWPAQYQPAGQTGNPAHVTIFNNSLNRGMNTKIGIGGQGDGMAYAQACDPTGFNPFNTTDAACVGTAILADKMKQAQSLVYNYHHDQSGYDLLGWTDVDKDNVFTAYVAADLYSGNWNSSWVRDYYWSWTGNSTYCQANKDPNVCDGSTPRHCYGDQYPGGPDFVSYVKYCELAYDPGATKMQYYYYMRHACSNSQCPDWQALYKAVGAAGGTEKPLPISGDALIPDQTPGK